MAINSWLRKLSGDADRKSRVGNHSLRKPTPRRFRTSRLELLEDRTVLSSYAVVNLLDSGPGSLRAAITSADSHPGADVISFAGGLKGTIGLASELTITDDLTIHGTNPNQLTISGGGTTRVFHVSGASTHLAIDGLTIAKGLASVPAGTAFGGALLNEAASVSLSHVVVANNQAVGAAGGGGGVANLAGAHLTADHTDFLGNTARGDDAHILFGGAVYDDQGSSANIEHGAFSGNLAIGGDANGGAIAQVGGGQLTLEHCALEGNRAQGAPGSDTFSGGSFGGAIEAQRVGLLASAVPTLTLAHCSFTGNQALVDAATNGADSNGQGNGGAIDIEDGAVATVSFSAFDGNQARGGDGGDGSAGNAGGAGGASFGGAISDASATVTVSNSRFTGNSTRGGNGGIGGVGSDGGDGAFGLGGAISCTALISDTVVPPVTTISNCQFLGNSAIGGDGGAGGSGGDGGFASRGDGGAIINLIGTMTVSQTSILQNAARGGAGGAAGSGAGTVGGDGGLTRGGGFSNERGGIATLIHNSIVNNSATGGAGAAGGSGGDALGGGVFNGRPTGVGPTPDQPANLTLIDCGVNANIATGGTGGVGGNGGNGFGGGIFNGNPVPVSGTPTVILVRTNVTANKAVGGASGLGGAPGLGQGGGLYNQIDAIADVDAFTKIQGNDASTSDDDIFGTLTPI